MNQDKIDEAVKFLLKSVRQLSDKFLTVNENLSRSFSSVKEDVSDLSERIQKVEAELLESHDQRLIDSQNQHSLPANLPVHPVQQKRIIPPLNLPVNTIIDIYHSNPILLQPFSRPCAVSSRTLVGEISEIELEVFAQGSIWILETQDGDWLLLPRPGVLQRQAQVESMKRLFELESDVELPAELELRNIAMATVIEHGRRWYLKEKGLIGLFKDPLQTSLESRLRLIEQKIEQLSGLIGYLSSKQ